MPFFFCIFSNIFYWFESKKWEKNSLSEKAIKIMRYPNDHRGKFGQNVSQIHIWNLTKDLINEIISHITAEMIMILLELEHTRRQKDRKISVCSIKINVVREKTLNEHEREIELLLLCVCYCLIVNVHTVMAKIQFWLHLLDCTHHPKPCARILS